MESFYKIAVKIHKFHSDEYLDIGIAIGTTIDELSKHEVNLFIDYCNKNNLDTRNYFIDNCVWLEWPNKKYEIFFI